MSRFIASALCFFLVMVLPGCVSVNKVVRDRVDQDVSGNRGYMQGSVPSEVAQKEKTREYIDVRVEIPTWSEVKENVKKRDKKVSGDNSASGNKGYISGNKYADETPASCRQMKKSAEPTCNYYEEEVIEEVVMPTTAVETYKVKEGDSLSKISKQVYGKASKWTVIYEANSDKIKDPNRLKVGSVLLIPSLDDKRKSQDIK